MTEKNRENKLTIAVNVIYVRAMDMCPAYVSKHKSYREKLVILLMVPDR